MMVRNNKNKVKEEFIKGTLDTLEVSIPNISDYVIKYADGNLELDEIIDECIDCKFHSNEIPSALFVYGGLMSSF